MTRLSKVKASAAEEKTAAAKTETAAEPTLEEKRRELARRLAIFASDWRRCSRPLCRRARACRLPDVTCFGPRQTRKPPMTREQEQQMMSRLKRMIERRLAEIRS